PVGVARFAVVASGYLFNLFRSEPEQLTHLSKLVTRRFQLRNDLTERFCRVPAAPIGVEDKDCPRPDAGHDRLDHPLRRLLLRRISRRKGPLNRKKARVVDGLERALVASPKRIAEEAHSLRRKADGASNRRCGLTTPALEVLPDLLIRGLSILDFRLEYRL